MGSDPVDGRVVERPGSNTHAEQAWELMRRAEQLLAPQTDYRGSVEQAVAIFEEALDLAGADAELAMAAHLAVAQLLGPLTVDADTDQLHRAATHAGLACEAADRLNCPEPGYSSASATHGALLLRLADRLPENDRNLAVQRGIHLLRIGVRSLKQDDPNRVARLANLATALQKPMRDAEPAEEDIRLTEAASIYDGLLHGTLKAFERSAIAASKAHVEQCRAAVARRRGDAGGADAAYLAAKRGYEEAIRSAQTSSQPAGAALMGLSRLEYEAARNLSDGKQFDAAIAIGEAALTELAGDLGFEREAQMQLAEQYSARLVREHRPSDAARADGLSREAVNSWYHEPGSIESTYAKHRRLSVLCAVALSPVGTDAHFLEIDELLKGLFKEPERTPQMAAIAFMAAIIRTIGPVAHATSDAYAPAVAYADQLEHLLTQSEFVDDDPAWWVRWLSTHRRIATWAEWIGIDHSIWLPVLAAAASRMELRLARLDSQSEIYVLASLLIADASQAVAILHRDDSELRRALGLLLKARAVGLRLSPEHRIRLGVDGSMLSEIASDIAGAETWIAYSRDALLDLEQDADMPLAARFAVDRQRYELAGTSAVLATDPAQLAWLLHSAVHPPPEGERARTAFLDEIRDLSTTMTLVFVAQSRLRCRAALITDGQWTMLDLSELSVDKLGAFVKRAHHTHAAAQSNVVGAQQAWHSARLELSAKLAAGLRPLSRALSEGTCPVTLRLSGWLHAVPVTPVLAAETGYRRPFAVALGLARNDPAPPQRSRNLVALAAPGDGQSQRHLARVVDDVQVVASMFDPSDAVLDATPADVVAALTESKMVLVASHGLSADQPDAASLILHNGRLTAAEIVSLDLRGLDLAVIAACEAFAADHVSPEHPFNVQTAIVRAGAVAACGPQWAIDDTHASEFTRRLFYLLAEGKPLGTAWLRALEALHQITPDLRDITLLIDRESSLLVR